MHINALDEVKVSVIDNEVWNSGFPRISQCNGFIIKSFSPKLRQISFI